MRRGGVKDEEQICEKNYMDHESADVMRPGILCSHKRIRPYDRDRPGLKRDHQHAV